MQPVVDLMEAVADRVSGLAQSDVVVGEPIKMGDVTIVPLSRVSVGFGAGGGEGEGEVEGHKGGKGGHPFPKGKGTGGGSGGGGRVRPVAVVVFGRDGVQVHSIPDRKGVLDKIFDRLPGVIETARKACGKDES